MKNFTIYNSKGKVLRTGFCQNGTFFRQAKEDEFVMEGKANGVTQKMEFDGFDEKSQPVNPRVVDKTSEEIEAEKPKPSPEIPFEKQPADITNEQLQDILNRLSALEI